MPTTNTQIRDLIEDKVVITLVELTNQVALLNGRVAIVETRQTDIVHRLNQVDGGQSAQNIDIARLEERGKIIAVQVQTTAQRVFDIAGKLAGLVAMVGVLIMLWKGG